MLLNIRWSSYILRFWDKVLISFVAGFCEKLRKKFCFNLYC
ncbi:hypothetical protein LEP1GSC125_3995 [Leptospira mayottensis 200901122]|uniref:Uncharacterized protein n=1 Tax=Leptospira mayottensis 200901122 TaxID=1193010 RepID=A0AA87MTP4_9LEPT|nr:hypothetical protein LEP1GSC125_3995 [Leptospira mayottensis 200901122]